MVCRPRRLIDLIGPAAAAVLLIVSAGSASTADEPPPSRPAFASPEQLHYSISWAGIPVGESTLVSRGLADEGQGPVYHFASTARSNRVLRLLYPVKTHIESIVDSGRFLPIRYTMTGRQGFQTRSRELRFDQITHTVELVMEGRTRTYPTIDAVQDPLSALYFYRMTATMEPGEVIRIPVHDRKRPKEIVVTAGPVERIETDAGVFQAARLNIRQTEEGLFLHEGDITVWITMDERRLPVRMEGRVTIGTVTAELEDYSATPSAETPQQP
ncbi:MAG: DUF3108 domain-containing protein [Nitrospirae bacterium]|nr:DUF3108 domain-containing protein [Nitrospirota bacterium]